LLCSSLSGQTDTASVGGVDGTIRYDERPETPATVASYGESEWDVNDSLQLLPCYDLYCGWQTDGIFPSHGTTTKTVDDGVSIRLSTAACDHTFPVCGGLNSDFGPRHGRMHYGVDLDLETGDPVVSAFEGVVRIARRHSTFGNVVVIRHWNGLETLYGHLSTIRVKPGESVLAGDTIGLGGSTGRSTGSHLHFETRYLGTPIDPKFIFDLETGELKNTTLLVKQGMLEATSSARSYHVVRRGETLSRIADRYGTTVKQLCKLNRISTRSTLRIGQRVRVR
jgi:murein DD-endopeptidase MepM/ murein hydrolase activator NlpD